MLWNYGYEMSARCAAPPIGLAFGASRCRRGVDALTLHGPTPNAKRFSSPSRRQCPMPFRDVRWAGPDGSAQGADAGSGFGRQLSCEPFRQAADAAYFAFRRVSSHAAAPTERRGRGPPRQHFFRRRRRLAFLLYFWRNARALAR